MAGETDVAGSVLFLCDGQADLDIARAVGHRIAALPVLRVAVLGPARKSLLRVAGGGFDGVVALGDVAEGDDGGGHPRAADLAGVRDHFQATTTRILAVILFDDRPPANAALVAAAAGLSIPTYLVQSDPALCLADMWFPVRGARPQLWGHARAMRIVVQGAGHALGLIDGIRALPERPYAFSAPEGALLGGQAWPPRREAGSAGAGDRTGDRAGDRPRLLVQAEAVTERGMAALAAFARDRGLALEPRLFGAADFALPPAGGGAGGGGGGFAVTGSPTAALALVREGYRAVLVGAAPGPGGAADPLLRCREEEGIAAALDALALRRPDPAWTPPADLAAWRPAVPLADTLAAEIEQRVRRQLRRTPEVRVAPGALAPNPLPAEGASAQLAFPLFPIAAFRAGAAAMTVPRVRRLVTISHDWSVQTGLARPMKYYNTAAALLGLDILVLTFDASRSADEIRALLHPDDFVIFNSFGIFERTDAAFAIYEALPPDRRCIYLHEMAWTFDRFREADPARHGRLAAHLAEANLLCVCAKQARFLAEAYGARRTRVVYNTTSLPEDEAPAEAPAAPRAGPVAAMIGTVQARKGAELFSAVADLARARRLGIALRWIGGRTEEAAGLYLSPHAAWLGRLDGAALTAALREVDLLFLSSADDPFPLSVIEAIQAGKRVVCYAGTGIEEVLRGVPGCAVFDDYTPEAALEAILRAFGETPDPAAYARLEAEVFGLTAFVNRMTAAIEAIRTGADGTGSGTGTGAGGGARAA